MSSGTTREVLRLRGRVENDLKRQQTSWKAKQSQLDSLNTDMEEIQEISMKRKTFVLKLGWMLV